MSFFQLSGIERDCILSDHRMKEAFGRAHNSQLLSMHDRHLLDEDEAAELHAVNNHARITIGRCLCEHLDQLFKCNDYCEHDKAVFFLTVIFKNGLCGLTSAPYELGSPRRLLQRDLRRMNYIGAIEPGLFLNLPEDADFGYRQGISWHAHLLVWDIGHHDAGRLVRQLYETDRYRAVGHGKPVHVRQVNNGELPYTVGYLFKPPMKSYRLTRYDNSKDGEPYLDLKGRPRSREWKKSSALRPGDRVNLYYALKHFCLDDLLVGGGVGSRLRFSVIRSARRLLHQESSIGKFIKPVCSRVTGSTLLKSFSVK